MYHLYEIPLTFFARLSETSMRECLRGSKPCSLRIGSFISEETTWNMAYWAFARSLWGEYQAELLASRQLLHINEQDSAIYRERKDKYGALDDVFAIEKALSGGSIVYNILHMMNLVGIPVRSAVLRVRFAERMSELEAFRESAVPQTDIDLNTILIGACGVGKTYYAISFAVGICEGMQAQDVMGFARAHYMTMLHKYQSLVKKKRVYFTSFHENTDYADLMESATPYREEPYNEGLFVRICRQAAADPVHPYVLIIDEMHRGNIARILGEGMVLLDREKRESISVILPQSQREFYVPANVYIIGIADSVRGAVVMADPALRRRFRFVFIRPQLQTLQDTEVEGVSVVRLLETMNERLRVLHGEEYAIGHTFFLPLRHNPSLALLGEIFRDRVLPCLRACVADDMDKLRLVLGNSPIVSKQQVPDGLFFSKRLNEEHLSVLPQSDVRWAQAETYRSIYEPDLRQ